MVRATAFEFRLRVWLMVAVIVIGFWSPWILWLHLGARGTAWLWLSFELGRLGMAPGIAIEVVTAAIVLLTAVAAALRLWGTAYLGASTVGHAEMQAGRVMADGPYRRVRNPLYLGSFFNVAAMAALMPASGAAFTMVVLALFLLRLILGEEAFLIAKLGAAYEAYKKAVPRLIPSLRARVPSAGVKADWGRAILHEILPLGMLISFAVLSWEYNSALLTRAVLVCFGLSLVVRAVAMPREDAAPHSA
ncbi:MAG TPA: isoprenylcysteine carboxylmethyltransferase family protein [Acidobacteriaceae bacterium]|nr:isoprenylcysteine carboxylmethyltransferase family protein [Acidobacteriaceae bacterium]